MEGLEAVELKLSSVLEDNPSHRIDSEFSQKELITNINQIKNYKNGAKRLGEYINVIAGGATPLGAEYFENGVPFIRVQNIMQNYFNLNDVVYISTKDDYYLRRSKLKCNDVLLTITGVSYGKSSVVNKKIESANINQHSVKIELNSNLNPYFLSTFLNSKFGKRQSDKNITGVTRPALDYQAIKRFYIPTVSFEFQNNIESIIKKSEYIVEQSEMLFTKAQQSLLTELKLSDWKPSNENRIIKKFSQSFGLTGRFDAEFFMPYFEEVENLLKTTFGFVTVEEICSDINYGTVPTSSYTEDGTEIPYIKGTNFKNTIIDSEGLDRLINTEELEERYFTQKGDIIISQMGTVGDTGVVEEHQIGWLFASFTIRIRIKDKKNFDTHFVAFYIQHIAKPYYLHRYIAQASVRQNTDLPTIKNMYIPKVPIEKQKEISKQIQSSFALRRKSSELLEAAKTAVEIAIEQDEINAMEYLRGFLD